MENRPNILFILADQHNAKVLGHAGHPNVRTPTLDRLAAEGVRFTDATTQNPICTPSRMCFLSGQYCHNHGYYGLSGPHPGGLPTFLGHFRRHGYLTGAIGKIHCPEYWVEDDSDIFHETCDCSIGGRSKAYEQFLRERGNLHLEDHIGLTEFGDRGIQSMEGRPSPLAFDESQEGWIANQTVAAMQQAQAAGRPFCLHASLPRPHQCTSPCREFWDLYEGVDLALPPNADRDLTGQAPNLIQTVNWWRTGDWTLLEPKTFAAARLRKLRGYLGAISQVDHAVGVMLDAVRRLGLADNTIVVYSADHGDYACEHGVMEKAPGICHDAITRIPMLWWAPGRVKAGHVAHELVETVDVSATLCRLAGLEPMETSDGHDLSHLLAGGAGAVRQLAVTEFAWSRAVRQGRWRLVWYADEYFPKEYPAGFGELYDLDADPWELRNLYFEPGCRDTVAALKAALLNWLVTTTRPATVHGLDDTRAATSGNWQRQLRYTHLPNADGKVNPSRLRTELSHRNYL